MKKELRSRDFFDLKKKKIYRVILIMIIMYKDGNFFMWSLNELSF